MNVIGLGQCGCNVAKCFEQYPQYKIYYINTEKIESKEYLFPEQEYYTSKENVNIGKTFLIPEQESHESYEDNAPDLSKFLKGVKGRTLFFIGGGGVISGVSLRVLEKLKARYVDVFYIRPDISLLSEKKKLIDRAVYNVLQEYSRSGALGNFHVIDNPLIESYIPDITIMNRWEKINHHISSTVHMINVYQNQVPVLNNLDFFSENSRLRTIGLFDVENNSEKLLFNLENVKEKCYYYAIPEKRLREDTDLLKMITEQVKEKTESGEIKVFHAVYPTQYEYPICYVLATSSEIQK
tara:strand:+ start:5353 stop:6240 length:888 start_codon:yes stop_codon:yes gene_type:complete